MHQNRRKKKRVNYGVRTVEVLRGTKGFGFTISGQQPCILSCIVPGSPAESAGLRAGDYLVSVNGHNVSKLPHDDVVQLIGRSKGILKLQIAENYYSDSSDEEGVATVRCKPKYTHKPRTSNMGALQLQCRVAKVVRDLQSGIMFDMTERTSTEVQDQENYCSLHYHWDMSSPLPPPPPPALHKRDSEKIVHRTVVGYLGTIDIPNQLHPSCMMQVLRKCIKRLKAEKRNPTTVLLTIHVANIKLTNSENRVIAEYPSYRIIFCNSFSEQDKQYFGILTKSVKDKENIVSNSCHVFTIYYKLIDHTVHSNACNIFGFTCTKTSELNVCQEFPDSCNSLIGAIQTLYISDSANADGNSYNEMRRQQDASSPQPSNISTSTAHSSNSDSGIGFKDDCTSRMNKSIPQNVIRRRCYPTSEYKNACAQPTKMYDNTAVDFRLTVRAVSNACWSDRNESDACKGNMKSSRESVIFNDFCNGISGCTASIENHEVHSDSQKGTERGNLTTCPPLPLPLPAASTTKQGLVSSSVGSLASVCTTAMLHGIEDRVETSDDSIFRSKTLQTFTKLTESEETNNRDKFSPKVFSNISKSLVHSFEDLKASMDYPRPLCQTYSDKSDNSRPWGSLQEIRNVGSCIQDTCLHGSTELCDKNTTYKGIRAWASGFEKLLEDPKGLQTFAEFLKKEFSHENIYFWAACERYKDTKDVITRCKMAGQIYQRHLSNTAAEPVNVDSHAAGQITLELLNEAPADLFLQAQKQVFNLMKFDSYPRFLRSDLYHRCIETGCSVVGTEDCDLNLTNSPSVKLKKSHSDAEDRCRKSILPWNRKNRSKSKDRGETEYNKTPSRSETIYKSFTTMKRESEGNNNDDSISISSSRSSLASWDLALRQSFHKHSLSSYEGQSNESKEVRTKCAGLCRVILPDGSTTVVPTSQTESIRDVVTRLLDKRALRYSNYDVLILATEETIEAKYPSSVLAGQEVEVVPTKILKVDLPSRRVITVVAHKGRTLKEVLKPLLNKYGFNVNTIQVWSENHCVCMDLPAIDSPARLTLTNVKDEDPQKELHTVKYTHDVPLTQPTLDEITNRVFEELLVGKGASKYQYNEGSCKSDDQRSEGSSILPSKFFLRDSTMHGKKKGKSKCSLNDKGNVNDYMSEETVKPHPPLIAKWRNGVKLQLPGKFDGEDLYEGLKRAQRSRLEDQRGTEINFELPDFLKNKENGKPTDRNKFRRHRIISVSSEANAKFYGSIEERKNYDGQDQDVMGPSKNGNTNEKIAVAITGKEALSKSRENSITLDASLIDGDHRTVVKNGSASETTVVDTINMRAISVVKSSKPPPLPPKPKNLITNVTKTGYIVSTKSLPKSTRTVPLSPTELGRKNMF
ncbi:PREDICTED: regulator of G-protein signaling loco [Dufourea novaeangliae]|uniref:Regulator of G-protein signaling loco n=1 Tax=Dufourea novaeangliae TaxID=178035 RepID=A0A154P248_DUFNO|nr:PREDICTED: regulator of G-protein signaling loco [Dufourea novaeangliae]KZC06006.1 Regulator of G-protein signaling loco [Dufourea novaeangliae]